MKTPSLSGHGYSLPSRGYGAGLFVAVLLLTVSYRRFFLGMQLLSSYATVAAVLLISFAFQKPMTHTSAKPL